MQMQMQPNSLDHSNVHIFSTFFMDRLRDMGLDEAEKWTKGQKDSKNKIDIFTKDLVFLPINESEHWSLCVVVNPSEIAKKHAW